MTATPAPDEPRGSASEAGSGGARYLRRLRELLLRDIGGFGPDQEWCVECGTARATLHPAPNWSGAVAVVAIVVKVVVIVGVVALVSLTH
jgi:hypothetical protein